MKYLIYARVSERGSGFEGQTTISMQMKVCEDYIRLSGGEVFDRRFDEFISGKNIEDRPAFSAIMEELRSGAAPWDAIIVYKFSRISRSLRDSLNIVAELQEHGKGFVSATEHFDCTTTTGQLFFNMLQSFNEFERKRTADTIRDKMMSIAEQGLWPAGNTPFGYRRGARKDNKLYVDPERAEIVRDIFESYVGDTPLWSILRRYARYLSKSRIIATLKNPAYIGLISYGGKIFPGQHEPIISKELFDRVQRKLPQPKSGSRPKAQKYPFLLTGLVFCTCGHRMTPATAKSGQYAYYRCVDDVHCRRRVSAPKAEKCVLEFFADYKLLKKIIERTREKIRQDAALVETETEPMVAEVQGMITKIKQEREKVFNSLLSDLSPSLVTMANNRMEELDAELEKLTHRLDFYKKKASLGTEAHKVAEWLLNRMKTLSEVLATAQSYDKDELRQILSCYLERIEDQGDGTFKIVPREAKNFPHRKDGESSTNGKEWYTEQNILELFCFMLKVA